MPLHHIAFPNKQAHVDTDFDCEDLIHNRRMLLMECEVKSHPSGHTQVLRQLPRMRQSGVLAILRDCLLSIRPLRVTADVTVQQEHYQTADYG